MRVLSGWLPTLRNGLKRQVAFCRLGPARALSDPYYDTENYTLACYLFPLHDHIPFSTTQIFFLCFVNLEF